MHSTWALIPVKGLSQSKSRLGPVLSSAECAQLSRAMLEDVLSAIGSSNRIDQIALLTDDPDIRALALEYNCTVIHDTAGELCAALDNAAAELKRAGAKTVVVIPSDMPTITSNDLDQLLAEHSDGLSLCSAYRDGGTNVLVCSPPDALKFQFGDNSAQKHLDSAAAAELPARLVKRRAFGQDIDTPDDLLWLSRQTGTMHSTTYLHSTGFAARIRQQATGAAT